MKKVALSHCCKGSRLGTPGKKINDAPSPIYEDSSISEKIPIKYISTVQDKRFQERIIYEGYKPHNLRSILDYMHFCLVFRTTYPSTSIFRRFPPDLTGESSPSGDLDKSLHQPMAVDDLLQSPEVSNEIKAYYNSDTQTKLPEQLDQDKILVFDSNFECGNLDRVSIASLSEYNLFLNPDTNTRGHSQWFYFAVTNTFKDRTVQFNILNCTKPVGLFKGGMRPLVLSELEYEENKTEWKPDTFNVSYYRNDIVKNPDLTVAGADTQPFNTYYTLTFSYTFKHTGDRVYFAYSRPYTLGMHFSFLRSIRKKLFENAKHIALLEEDGLQRRIKQFINTPVVTDSTPKKSVAEEDQLKQKHKRSPAKAPSLVASKVPTESPFAPSELLKKFNESTVAAHEHKFEWMKCGDFQVESQGVIYRQETLCRSFCGVPIAILTITNTKYFYCLLHLAFSSKKHPLAKRKIVVITARVHAAEATGSFKVEGIVKFLVSDNPLAVTIRDLYIFKVVPMLNPEGVLTGNFRCSLTGTDLNRRWDQPDEILHPQIFFLKHLLKKLVTEKKEILVFCDLHGHSRKNNAFVYGCNKAANGGFCSWTKVRLLPRIIATKTPMFSYNDCKFRVEGSKQRTARVVVWKEFGVTNSFTLESSFFGYLRGDEVAQFEPKDYRDLGQAFLESLAEYYYVLKGLENEFIITKGWLKPSKLLAVTGVLAADALAKKIANEKVEVRRKKRIQEINELAKKRRDKEKKKKKRRHISPDKERGKNNRRESYNSPQIKKDLPLLKPNIHRRGESMKASHKASQNIENTSQAESNPYLPEIPIKPAMPQFNFTDSEFCPIKGNMDGLPSNDTIEETKSVAFSETSGDIEMEGTINKEWRKYFEEEELEIAYNQINAGVDPNDKEDEENSAGESDSNPSEDNLEVEEMRDFFSCLPRGNVIVGAVIEQKAQRKPTIGISEGDKKGSKVELISKKPQQVVIPKIKPKEPEKKVVLYSEAAPSMIITSKNKTKEVSLVTKEGGMKRARHYNTLYDAEGQAVTPDKYRSAQRRIKGGQLTESGSKQAPITIISNNFPKIQRSKPSSNEKMLSMAQDDSVTIHVFRKDTNSNSRNLIKDTISSVPQTEILPTLVPSKPGTRKGPELESVSSEPSKYSTNIKLPIDSHENSPTININIRNVSINSPVFGNQYEAVRQSSRHWNSHVGSVISSIPRHDKSPAFQKLFSQSDKYKEEHRREVLEYYNQSQRKAKRTGSTLEELIVGGYIPINVRDYIMAYKKGETYNPAKRPLNYK
eukprot:TRINITY_DN310_c0_g2_i1.p1 TRINITY_DN310_c0_g2~~TRINITY_DN310_c0_g2_i1.p1  ORF type:complete len:1282 (-),score=157.74 TRINITY_DN310_c0_g2_i1:3773-7618(-)